EDEREQEEEVIEAFQDVLDAEPDVLQTDADRRGLAREDPHGGRTAEDVREHRTVWPEDTDHGLAQHGAESIDPDCRTRESALAPQGERARVRRRRPRFAGRSAVAG